MTQKIDKQDVENLVQMTVKMTLTVKMILTVKMTQTVKMSQKKTQKIENDDGNMIQMMRIRMMRDQKKNANY